MIPLKIRPPVYLCAKSYDDSIFKLKRHTTALVARERAYAYIAPNLSPKFSVLPYIPPLTGRFKRGVLLFLSDKLSKKAKNLRLPDSKPLILSYSR